MNKRETIIDVAIREVAKEQRESSRLRALQAQESLRVGGRKGSF